jgi:ribulose bisphosphate carboxylase small subunit
VRVSDDQVNAALSAVGAQFNSSGGKVTVAPGSAPETSIDPVQYLLQHGYTQVTSYQPDSRYWTLQWIEFGWLTTLAVLLLGTAFWLLRRRPA